MDEITNPVGPIAVLAPVGSASPTRLLSAIRHAAAEHYGAVQAEDFSDVVLLATAPPTHQPMSGAALTRAAAEVNLLNPSVVGVASVCAEGHLAQLGDTIAAEMIDLPRAMAVLARQHHRPGLLLTCREAEPVLSQAFAGMQVPFTTLRKADHAAVHEVLRLVAADDIASSGERLASFLAQRPDDGSDLVHVGCAELSAAVDAARRVRHLPGLDVIEVLADALTRRYYEVRGRRRVNVLADNLVVL